MPNNFKITGDVYVSVDGSDSNSGLTKDLPKRTVQAGLNLVSIGQTLVIGSGFYRENISKTYNGGGYSIVGDGVVVLDGNNASSNFVLYRNNTGTHDITIADIIFNNYNSIQSQANNSQNIIFVRCLLINIRSITYTTNAILSFNRSTLINCPSISGGSAGGLATAYCTYSIFINCQILAPYLLVITNSYFSSSTYITVSPSITAANFNYNNIQCPIIMNVATAVTTGVYQDIYGRYYDLSQAGTNPSGNGSLAQPFWRAETSGKAFSYTNHRILYPTFNANSISQDPKFNNIQAQDFTLQADSPHIGRAGDGVSNIGGTKYAIRHAANGSAFNTAAVSITGLTMVGTNWTSTGTNGQVISSPIFISNTVKVVQTIRYNGLLEFNKALGAGPVVGNRNVPDNYVYGTGTQGANPDRLVYEIRYSTQVAEPASDSEWDNGSYITAGNYFVMEWNTKPSFDTAFVGNGDPTFNASATPTFLNATWIQLKVTLRNNYV